MRAEQTELTGAERCTDWLGELEAGRNLTLPLTGAGETPTTNAVRRFVGGLRAEMIAFRDLVESAASIATLNAEQLQRIVSNTVEQSAVVEQTAAALAEIDQGAAHVAQTAEGLRAVTATLAESTVRYDAGIDSILAALANLVVTVEAAAAIAASLGSGSNAIRAFPSQLRRIARQARLLAINAEIEAAHLGERGGGFVIVAHEVKKLAASTADSATNVVDIEKELHGATSHVEKVIGASAGLLRSLAVDLDAARERSAQTREQVHELEGAIGDVAAIVNQQSATLSAISGGVEQMTRHAREVAGAAQRAARLAIGDAIEHLQATIGAYRLGEAASRQPAGDDLAAAQPSIRDAAQRLRARVDADQRVILTIISGISVSVARNSYEWRSIAGALGGLQAELGTTTRAIDETAAGAALAAQASGRMRLSLDAMRAGFGASIDQLQQVLERVARVRDDIQHAESLVTATSNASARAAAILDLIDTISSETTLLSLNAAIEAAHAGTAGSGFGIIADEIRTLADTTSRATQEIVGAIDAVSGASRSMIDVTSDAVGQTVEVHGETTHMRTSVGELRVKLDATLGRAADVAGIVEQQLIALGDVRRATELAAKRVESDTGAATDRRRLELAMLGMRAHALAARRPLGTTAEEIRTIGLGVAAQMDAVFDAALAKGAITFNDYLDTDYVEINGPAIARLGRLFDVSRVPERGFDPPKFATRYDAAVEDGLNRLIDQHVPKHAAITAMLTVDLNGYCFGHFRDCRRAWTGDRATDLSANRIKRFFEDELSLRCARVGLGEAADSLPARTPYARFEQAGCDLRFTGERPWAIYTYARDNGIVYNDLSVALFAQRRRVGTVRIIYDADAV